MDMTNTKEPSKHCRDIAAKLAESSEMWHAISDACRASGVSSVGALARIVQMVHDEQLRAVAAVLAAEPENDHPDFDVVGVDRCEVTGSGEFFQVVARLWGPIGDSGQTWGGVTSTWLGIQAIDGSLTCVGWDSADQWVDATVDRRIGTTSAVALGERILSAAEVRS